MTALQEVLLHLVVASGAISMTPAVAGAVRPQFWVFLRNDARAEQRLVDNAKAEVTRLYALIDVDLIWVTGVPTPEKPLHVICLVTKELDGQNLPESALGVTPTGLGHRSVLAYVFLRRIERASQRFKARIDFVLAVTISHELAHMLMPDGPHTRNGLMRAKWGEVDFGSASTGFLRFSRESAELIRRGLADQTVSSASARSRSCFSFSTRWTALLRSVDCRVLRPRTQRVAARSLQLPELMSIGRETPECSWR